MSNLILDNYFNIIPSELAEIILSYVESLDLDNLINIITTPINWSTIYYYHFGEYRKINYNDYKTDLGLFELKSIFRLIHTLDVIKTAEYFLSQ